MAAWRAGNRDENTVIRCINEVILRIRASNRIDPAITYQQEGDVVHALINHMFMVANLKLTYSIVNQWRTTLMNRQSALLAPLKT